MNERNVISIVSKLGVLPSYLQCFEENNVNLIFAKKPSLTSDSDANSSYIKKEIVHDESLENFDLTGDPLEVDLGENVSISVVKLEQRTERWTADEARHFPLPVREARRELNKILTNIKCDQDCLLPTYIVCGADDNKKTILLGGNSTDYMTCSIHALGTLQQSEAEKKLEEMVDDHLRNCFKSDGQIKYLVNLRYNLYGRSLQTSSYLNAAMRQKSTHGNIYVDIVCPKKVFRIAETDEGNMKMHLELVAGHKLLSLNFLWEELVKLQALIDILLDSKLSSSSACEEIIICDEPLDPDIILQSIVELMSATFLRPEREKDSVNLDNLRQEDLLDRLWKVLIRCENVSILRDSFNFLFEELAEGSIMILPIKDNCSNVSMIIKAILRDKSGVPTISLPRSVELLYELGAQKLKFDFQVILKHAKGTIDSVWKSFYQNDLPEVKKFKRTRTTRKTSHIGSQNVSLMINQLAYLSQLYVGSEFIYLLKDQVNLNDDAFSYFCRCVEKEYILYRNRIIDFNEIYQSPLNEMSFELDLRNASFVQSMFPSRWTMSMETERHTTIYDLADSPIFPNIIFDYDAPASENENMHYYVSKMSRSTGLF